METADHPFRLLVFGAAGQVGQALLHAAQRGRFTITGFTHREVDITRPDQVAAAMAAAGADLVVNAAAYTAVDRAESEPEAAFAINRDGPAVLATACTRQGVPLIHISSDYVFDGTRPGALREDDPTGPVNVYGASKLAGELAVRERIEWHVILRTAWVYSATGTNFVKTMLRLGAERAELRIVADQTGCPTAAADIAAAIIVLAERLLTAPADAGCGTYHYCSRGDATWFDFAGEIFRLARRHARPSPRLTPIDTASYPTPARRPANSVLDCSRIERDYGVVRPPWQASLAPVIDDLLQRN